MNIERIKELRQALDDENISLGELLEIEEAFKELDPDTLRDLPENALAIDMLDELEDNATLTDKQVIDALIDYNYQLSQKLEEVIPDWYFKSELIAEINDFWVNNIDGKYIGEIMERNKDNG